MMLKKIAAVCCILMLLATSAYAAPGGKSGGAANPPGQTTFGPDDWSLSDCIKWSREAGFWNVVNKPNEYVHWWLFGYFE